MILYDVAFGSTRGNVFMDGPGFSRCVFGLGRW